MYEQEKKAVPPDMALERRTKRVIPGFRPDSKEIENFFSATSTPAHTPPAKHLFRGTPPLDAPEEYAIGAENVIDICQVFGNALRVIF